MNVLHGITPVIHTYNIQNDYIIDENVCKYHNRHTSGIFVSHIYIHNDKITMNDLDQ